MISIPLKIDVLVLGHSGQKYIRFPHFLWILWQERQEGDIEPISAPKDTIDKPHETEKIEPSLQNKSDEFNNKQL